MRLMILVLMLSACSAYPQVHWPGGAPDGPTPALVPQSEVMGGPVAQDQGPALVARADALRAWANTAAQ
jgi:hypothetical protein